MNAVMVPVFIKNLDQIERIEQMIAMAVARRNAALHEIDRHRSTLAYALGETIERIEEGKPQAVAPKALERIRRER
jgi:hypothetical protein